MKKLLKLSVWAILLALVIVSCNKPADIIQPQIEYAIQPQIEHAKFVSGNIFIQDGDVTLKTLPVGVTRYLYMYKQLTSGVPAVPAPSGTFALVDGSEFLAGSDPAIFWGNPANNPGHFPATLMVYSNYTPAMQIRMVAKTEDASNVPAYLGIFDVLPNAASFPVYIYGKRLGDVLTLDTDELTALPGYTNMSFAVTFDKSTIDVPTTMITSGPTSLTDWPDYIYSGTASTTVSVPFAGSGAKTVYDGLDAKITGTINIAITVDGTTITVSTPAVAIGHGLALTLKTNKVGWYDSATMQIYDNDVTVDAVDIDVN